MTTSDPAGTSFHASLFLSDVRVRVTSGVTDADVAGVVLTSRSHTVGLTLSAEQAEQLETALREHRESRQAVLA